MYLMSCACLQCWYYHDLRINYLVAPLLKHIFGFIVYISISIITYIIECVTRAECSSST